MCLCFADAVPETEVSAPGHQPDKGVLPHPLYQELGVGDVVVAPVHRDVGSRIRWRSQQVLCRPQDVTEDADERRLDGG